MEEAILVVIQATEEATEEATEATEGIQEGIQVVQVGDGGDGGRLHGGRLHGMTIPIF